MILSDVSVTRPVFASVMSLLLIAFGLLAFDRLPLREYPDIDPPVVSIDHGATERPEHDPRQERERGHERHRKRIASDRHREERQCAETDAVAQVRQGRRAPHQPEVTGQA